MLVVNTWLDSGYTLNHRPRKTVRRGGGVVVLINRIKHQSRRLHDKPELTSFESIELVTILGSITIRLSVIYRMPPVKSKNGLKQGEFCNELNDYLEAPNDTAYKAPNNTTYKRWLSQRTQAAVQIVSNLPAPSNGAPIYCF